MPRPVRATLDLAALRHNLSRVRQYAPHSGVWAVVKANAYGHGLRHVWRALSGCDGFALIEPEAAVLLREEGWTGPVLLLEGFFDGADLALIDRYRLTTTVHSEYQLSMLEQATPDQPINVYLKINSGMNRLGFPPHHADPVYRRLRDMPAVGEITLMTHFANADNPHGIDAQFQVFRQATADIPGPRSLANSAATLWHPQSHFQWVRPGIILYGASPSGRAADIATTGLQPVMSLTSEIIAVQEMRPGDAIGYGSRYRAERPLRVGIVACGYGDGYPRHAPSGTPVWVAGERTGLLGAVSMDMLAIDLTALPGADIGTPVELWGKHLPVDEVAQAAGTLGYELLCALAPRVAVETV